MFTSEQCILEPPSGREIAYLHGWSWVIFLDCCFPSLYRKGNHDLEIIYTSTTLKELGMEGYFFFAAGFSFFGGLLVPCFPAFLLLCASVSLLLLLLCFSCFSAFLLLCFHCFSAFPASMLFCFSAFCFPCFFAFLLLCFPCFFASLLLCFCAFLLLLFYFFFSSVMCFCCSTSCSSASLLPVFTVSVFFIFFCFILSCLYPRETLGETQRNPTWNPK